METLTISNYSQEKFSQLQEDLALFDEMGVPPIKKLQGKMNAIQTYLDDLKQKVKNEGFANRDDEVQFFKRCKPGFVAAQIFVVEIFKIETDKPLGDETMLKAYLEVELNFIKKFLAKHQFLYQYYTLAADELDEVYFIRNVKSTTIMIQEQSDQDPDFSTAGDYLFGRFRACEELQRYLVNKLYGSSDIALFSSKVSAVKWTGDKVNLVELAYGLWLTKQINDGQASLTQIIKWMEDTLDISIGNVQMHFGKIKSRKRLSITKFYDMMRDEVLKKIEADFS